MIKVDRSRSRGFHCPWWLVLLHSLLRGPDFRPYSLVTCILQQLTSYALDSSVINCLTLCIAKNKGRYCHLFNCERTILDFFLCLISHRKSLTIIWSQDSPIWHSNFRSRLIFRSVCGGSVEPTVPYRTMSEETESSVVSMAIGKSQLSHFNLPGHLEHSSRTLVEVQASAVSWCSLCQSRF
jgi:hypothetical protein